MHFSLIAAGAALASAALLPARDRAVHLRAGTAGTPEHARRDAAITVTLTRTATVGVAAPTAAATTGGTVDGTKILNMTLMSNALGDKFDTTMNADLEALLPMPGGTVVPWADDDSIPMAVAKFIARENMSPADFEVYDVHLNDCTRPWTIARHKSANVSVQVMGEQFSKVPVGMRQWVQNIIAFPITPGCPAGLTESSIVGIWEAWRPGVLFHEFSHVMDQADLGDEANPTPKFGGNWFSASSEWRSLALADARVPSRYIAGLIDQDLVDAAWVEEFADTGRAAIQEMVVGNLDRYSADWTQVKGQLNGYNRFLRQRIMGPTSCIYRQRDSPPVSKTAVLTREIEEKLRKLAAREEALDDGITMIDVPDDYNALFPGYGIHHSD